MYKKRVTPQIEIDYLNRILTNCGKGDVTITKVNCLDKTERGDEYTVTCSDEQERILLQHFCGNGITWMWEEDYDEFC